jgi:hypothetical protein
MRRKSSLLIIAVVLYSFAASACVPFSLLRSAGEEQGTGNSRPRTANRRKSGSGAPKVLEVDKDARYVNVMGKEMPEMPEFDNLSAKPGKVRGYVKDLDGNPLKGARLGVRSTAVGGYYSGSQGETDSDGYYEFSVPAGVAHFYNAGYAIDWGEEGLAALGLHPVDGKLDSFASTTGGVENFVLLPYGITSRENTAQNGHLASTYYGGSIYLHYYGAEAGDANPMPGTIPIGSVVEITLVPEGEMYLGAEPQQFTVRKTVGYGGGFYIHNLPLGRYRISMKTSRGERIKMELNKPRSSEYGIKPAETTDAALLTFSPGDARAEMVVPQYGGWSAVELNISRP